MESISQYLIIFQCFFFFILETTPLIKSLVSKTKGINKEMREIVFIFNIITFSAILFTQIIFYMFFNLNILISIYINILIIGILVIMEFLFYFPIKQLQFNPKNDNRQKKIFILIFALLIISLIPLIPNGIIASGQVLTSQTWIDIIFENLLNEPMTQAYGSLLIIGGLAAIIGKTRGSMATLTAAYFLILFIPILTLMNSMFMSDETLYLKANIIYSVFASSFFTRLIYLTMQALLYSFASSLVLIFINMIQIRTIS